MRRLAGGVVTPFLMAASAAAWQRKELQQAMKDSLNKAKALEKEKEAARKKKAEEEAVAAAATDAAKASGAADIDGIDLKEVSLDLDGALLANGGKEGEEDGMGEDNRLAGVVHNLDKTTPVKKRSRNTEEEQRKSHAAGALKPLLLRQSSVISHNYGYSRVIMEGSAWLDQDDKAAQFIRLVGMLLTNGKMVDSFFVINLVIIGGGEERTQGDAKDVPTNMMTLGDYVKLTEQSIKMFQKKSAGLTGAKTKKESTRITGGVN